MICALASRSQFDLVFTACIFAAARNCGQGEDVCGEKEPEPLHPVKLRKYLMMQKPSKGLVFVGLCATRLIHLYRRTFDSAIAAIHAAIPVFRLYRDFAVRTCIKVLTGINRHGFLLLKAAMRASDCRFENDIFLHWFMFCLISRFNLNYFVSIISDPRTL